MDRARRSVDSGERRLHPIVVGPAAFAVFAGIGGASSIGATRHSDLTVRRHIRPRQNKTATRVAHAISRFGAPNARPIVAGGLALCFQLSGIGRPSRIVAATLFATALEKASRLALRQKRPPGAGTHHGLDVYAYPSGHCCAVGAIMTTAVRELSRGHGPRVRNALAAAGVVASIATAWSRLYLDEHWIDDVIGGLFAGLAIGLTVTDA